MTFVHVTVVEEALESWGGHLVKLKGFCHKNSIHMESLKI